MVLTPEQEKIGKENFSVRGFLSRREFLKGAAAGGVGLGALYFGYGELKGEPVRTAVIGTGDEGNVLITQHPPKYMQIVAIADLRPTNRDRAFTGSDNEARIGLNRKLGADVAAGIKRFANHKELLAAKDELKLEAVVIAVPLSQHAPIAKECLEAGLHVLTEKLDGPHHHPVQGDDPAGQGQEPPPGGRPPAALQRPLRQLRQPHQERHAGGHQVHPRPVAPQQQLPRQRPVAQGIPKEDMAELEKVKLTDFGYRDPEELINWRLYNTTGGGLMAELGSHQMDACSIFLGKVHPLAVQGYGGKNFYGVPGVGPEDKWKDDREIFDHIYVTFEFPGAHHKEQKEDIAIVTYSSISTNKFEPYGETVLGSRGTLLVRTEKEALLYKKRAAAAKGRSRSADLGRRQQCWRRNGSRSLRDLVRRQEGGASGGSDWSANISRGYTEEMEHFCFAIRNQGPNYWPDGKPLPPSEGGSAATASSRWRTP